MIKKTGLAPGCKELWPVVRAALNDGLSKGKGASPLPVEEKVAIFGMKRAFSLVNDYLSAEMESAARESARTGNKRFKTKLRQAALAGRWAALVRVHEHIAGLLGQLDGKKGGGQ